MQSVLGAGKSYSSYSGHSGLNYGHGERLLQEFQQCFLRKAAWVTVGVSKAKLMGTNIRKKNLNSKSFRKKNELLPNYDVIGLL